jgi:hypothetical protein
MSYMADTDHIAITCRDKSTTRCKFLYQDARLSRLLPLLVVRLILPIVS